MRILYSILICFAAPVAALIAWVRGIRYPERRERLADRFGRPSFPAHPQTASRLFLWVHAASMGEVQAGAVLVRQLLSHYPEHDIVMTTMTTTGAARVKALFPERVSHSYLPYDLPFAVHGFLDRVRPKSAIILETELWPNLLCACRDRGIPVTIASARISPRTADRYRQFASVFRGALTEVVVAAQSTADAERFAALGARNVRVTGNIKFDIDIAPTVRETAASLRGDLGKRFVWVAGSTHEGEEALVLDAHAQLLKQVRDALLVLTPRHPQRFVEVQRLLEERHVNFVSRSSGNAFANASVLLVDTMGELLAFYAAADLAFVGGTLVPVGGHNLLEPAALGVATLCGPHTSNTQDAADLLLNAQGLVQIAPQELAEQVTTLASNSERRAALANNALHVIRDNRGALQRVMQLIKVIDRTA